MRLSHGAMDLLNEIPGETYLQDKGDLSISRTTLFLDFGARLTDEWAFKMITRAYYDSMWDLDSDIYDEPEDDYSGPDRDRLHMRRDVEFREYYITYRQ